MTENLPKPTPPFSGRTDRLLEDAEPRRLEVTRVPEKAPNVLLVMLDDVGFGSFSSFGAQSKRPLFKASPIMGLSTTNFTPLHFVHLPEQHC